MTEPVFVNPFTFTKGFTVDHRDEEYPAYVKPPDVITDEMLPAVIARAVAQAIVALRLAGKLKTGTTAADGISAGSTLDPTGSRHTQEGI